MFSKNRKLKLQDPNCNLNKWTDRRKKNSTTWPRLELAHTRAGHMPTCSGHCMIRLKNNDKKPKVFPFYLFIYLFYSRGFQIQ